MTVFEASQQLGIAYCNKFLFEAGKKVYSKYLIRRRGLGLPMDPAKKTQDEFGRKFIVNDYHDSFSYHMKIAIVETLESIKTTK